jgi:hypothetical protein
MSEFAAGLMCLYVTPSEKMTSANSLIWERLIATTPAVRVSSRRNANSGYIAAKRLTMTNATPPSAASTAGSEGSGIFRPSATKKRVRKKSRTPPTREMTSVPYG